MVIAIFLFLTYHFIGIFAKNSAKDGSFNPIIATWFSTIIMLPLGVYLTKRATEDRGLFEFDHILVPLKKLASSKGTKKKNKFNDLETDSNLNVQSKEAFIKLFADYKVYSRFTIIFYWMALILFILYFILKNNKLEEIASVSIQLSIISFIVYVIYFFQTRIIISKIFKLVEASLFTNNILSTLFILVLYPIAHYIRRIKLDEVLPK
jgi:lipopolysaccharide export system permease protein